MEKQLIPELRFPYYNDDWDKVVLEKITTKISDGIHSTPNYDLNGEYYFVNGNNLVNGSISINENTKKVSLEEFKKHKRPLSKNSILLSINGTIGNLALYNNENIVLGKSACYINLQKDLPIDFYYYILQTPKIKKYFLSELTGSTIMNLSLRTIKATKLIVPSLTEQQKIASFLSDVDTVITKLTKKKDLLEQYKKGIMQKIFNQKLRFKDDEGNEFPEWEVKMLGDVFTFKQGFQFGVEEQSETYFKGSVEFIRIINVTSDKNDKRYVLDPGKEHHINKEDLFMVRYGDAGRVANGFTGIIANNMFRLLPNFDINKLFFFYNLGRLYNKIHSLSGSSTMPAISFSTINKLKIIVPSLEEQTKIANFLSDIDIKIEVLNTKIENSKTFKKGLLQQMFV